MDHFMSVTEDAIEEAEEILGFPIPEDLRTFYQKEGSGFLPCRIRGNANVVFHPRTTVDFRRKKRTFEGLMCIDKYKPYNEKYLVFFEVNDFTYFSVPIDPVKHGVYYMDQKIADSVQEFVDQMIKDERYFFHLYSQPESEGGEQYGDTK